MLIEYQNFSYIHSLECRGVIRRLHVRADRPPGAVLADLVGHGAVLHVEDDLVLGLLHVDVAQHLAEDARQQAGDRQLVSRAGSLNLISEQDDSA